MKVLLIEDDLGYALSIEMLMDTSKVDSFDHVSNETELSAYLKENIPDVIICDVLINGQEVFEIIKKFNLQQYQLIVVTSYNNPRFMSLAKDLGAVSFLIKPLDALTLQFALEKAFESIHHSKEENHRISIKHRDKLHFLKTSDVRFISVDGNYIYVYTDERKFAIRMSMNEFIENYNGFIRVHRKFAINPSFIENVNLRNDELTINGRLIPLGRRYKRETLNLLKAN